ncbi:MAG: hypothetical protein J5640_05550 [Bacteroidales bacterium]|nr:hypothetical protein [Bacteroidales bacterium]
MRRLFIVIALLAACQCVFGQGSREDGLWMIRKSDPVDRQGFVEGDAFVFSRPVDKLPAGTWVEFGVTLENAGDKAPLHYMVEFYDGGKWVSDPDFIRNDGLSDYSFYTVTSTVRHPSVFLATYRFRSVVRDTLKVRCRVCSSYAVDRSTLDAADPENLVGIKKKSYVGAYLQPLGRRCPAHTKDVLLVGNSFTYYHGEPFILEEIAFSQGWRLNIGASLKGGQTYRQHCGLQMTLHTCTMGRYDYAFIQGQSQEPAQYAADPAGKKDVLDSYMQLCGYIREISPRAKIYVENTWGYPAISNGGFESLEEFDCKLDEGTTLLASAAGTAKSLVGQVFTAARDEFKLLDKDDKHQSLAGSYLKACVTYLTISGRRFKGEVPSCGLPEADAARLREIAEQTVLGR